MKLEISSASYETYAPDIIVHGISGKTEKNRLFPVSASISGTTPLKHA
jgi:hypothetical protein